MGVTSFSVNVFVCDLLVLKMKSNQQVNIVYHRARKACFIQHKKQCRKDTPRHHILKTFKRLLKICEIKTTPMTAANEIGEQALYRVSTARRGGRVSHLCAARLRVGGLEMS